MNETLEVRVPPQAGNDLAEFLRRGGYVEVESRSHPGEWYRVNGKCGCRGYSDRGSCAHTAAVDALLGRPVRVAPDPEEIDWADWRTPQQKEAERVRALARYAGGCNWNPSPADVMTAARMNPDGEGPEIDPAEWLNW